MIDRMGAKCKQNCCVLNYISLPGKQLLITLLCTLDESSTSSDIKYHAEVRVCL